jgi:transcriptional regulator
MPRSKNPFLHGTLELLLLKTLTRGGRHGYGIARQIEEATGDEVKVEEGSLYPALERMEKRGWVRSEWGLSEHGRKARFYRLTDRGRERLEEQSKEWSRFAKAVSKVLEE